MSEDEDLDEREALEREEAERQYAFKDRFKLKAFEGVARALKMPVDKAHLERLGWALWIRFYAFYETCSAPGRSRREAKAHLRQLRNAANLLASSYEVTLALWMHPEIKEGEKDIFVPTAKRLAKLWDAQLGRRARVGRKPHAEFHEFVADLVPLYERLTGKTAIEPWQRRPATSPRVRRYGQGRYGSEFYDFMVEIRRCVWDHIPEAHQFIPVSDDAVADALINHWPKLEA
jgi:hypothetical protein